MPSRYGFKSEDDRRKAKEEQDHTEEQRRNEQIQDANARNALYGQQVADIDSRYGALILDILEDFRMAHHSDADFDAWRTTTTKSYPPLAYVLDWSFNNRAEEASFVLWVPVVLVWLWENGEGNTLRAHYLYSQRGNESQILSLGTILREQTGLDVIVSWGKERRTGNPDYSTQRRIP